jgi:hypothetical protein
MKHIVFRIIAALVLLAAIASVAFFAFNAGVARGEAANLQAPANQSGTPAYPFYGMPYWRPFPFFGFGFLGLFALFIPIFLIFSAARFIIWGPRFRRHWMHGGPGRWSRWGNGDSEQDIPPMVAEMHRRMHEADKEKPADAGTQK